MKMLRYALVFSFLTLTASAQTEQRITVGTQPTTLIQGAGSLIVINAGHDLNFNTVFEPDSGDKGASVHILDATTFAQVSSTDLNDILPFAPYRPALSAEMPVYYKRNMIFPNASFSPALPDSLGNIYGLEIANDPEGVRLMLSMRDTVFTKPDYVVEAKMYDPVNKLFSVRRVFPSGINPQQIMRLSGKEGKERFAVLNEGSFGSENSTLQFIIQDSLSSNSIFVPLGNGGNHFYRSGDSLYVVLNGSHKVMIVSTADFNNPRVVDSIDTKTSGYDGPREALVDNGILYVSTYAGDVRKFDIATKELLHTYLVSGKAEALAIVNGRLVVANSLKKDYSPDNALSVFELVTGVEESMAAANVEVYPNPAGDRAVLSAAIAQFEGTVNVDIHSALGEKIASYSFFANESFSLALPVSNYAGGQYFARVSAGSISRTISFIVAR